MPTLNDILKQQTAQTAAGPPSILTRPSDVPPNPADITTPMPAPAPEATPTPPDSGMDHYDPKNEATWPTHQLYEGISARQMQKYLEKRGLIQKAALAPMQEQQGQLEAQKALQNAQSGGDNESVEGIYRQFVTPVLGVPVPRNKDGTPDMAKVGAHIRAVNGFLRGHQFYNEALKEAKPVEKSVTTPEGATTVTREMQTPSGEMLGAPQVVKQEAANEQKRHDEFASKRVEGSDEVKAFRLMDNTYSKAAATLNIAKPNNVQDEQLVDAFVKITDPSGVIRQSKIAYVNEAVPLVDKAQTWLAKLRGDKGAIMDPATRQQFRDALINSEKVALQDAQGLFGKIVASAERFKLHPDDIGLSQRELQLAGGQSPQHIQPAPTPGTGPGAGTAAAAAPVGSPSNPWPFTTDTDIQKAPPDAQLIIDKRPGGSGKVFHNPNYKPVAP